MIKAKGLGRGLDALLNSDGGGETRETLATARLEQLRPGRYQPRTRMDEESLNELAQSIRSQGLMQPILVRNIDSDRYEIIAGERRWRAARIAGLAEVPIVVRDVPDQAALAMALIENIQRENLNPLEEATGIQRLIDEFKLTHQEAADAVGRSRAATTNLLRLLNLERPVKELLMEGRIDMGHARALLALEGTRQTELAKKVDREGCSVRETEQLVQGVLTPKVKKPPMRPRTDRDIARLEEEVSARLGTSVEIKPGKKGAGKLVVGYMSHDHLDELIGKLTR
ncbi:MAG: ParB/RepB/Spo0J family partition protein [Betaproteobacteria bacterium]|jgi:ParB family chromosome partitioning protein|nr:ParB/RepB/Spo0J family partition protein [Betaproteobacteria bacterium]